MKFGKRQLILATLVVALGAAVYLSWMLSDHQGLRISEPEAASSEYGAAVLVNAGEEEIARETMAGVSSGEEAAQETAAFPEEETGDAETMAQARVARQQARDSAADILEEFLEKADENDGEASRRAALLADRILKENNIETLIRAKGYEDCIAILEDGTCNIIVKIGMAQPNDAVIIKDIVHTQTGLDYGDIKIIELTR